MTRSIFLTVLVLLFIVGILAFLLGTIVGFNTAIESISGCTEVPCDRLGIEAEYCELCPQGDLFIRKSARGVG